MTSEALIRELTNWEDPDSTILVIATKGGGVAVSDYDGGHVYEAATLEGALQAMYDAWKASE